MSFTLLAFLKNRVGGMTIVLHFSAVCVTLAIPFLCVNFVTPSLFQFLGLLLIGTAGGVGQIALTFSFRMSSAGEISIYNYTGIIFSAVIAYWVLEESLKYSTAIGGGLVILVAVLVYKYS